MGFHKNNRLGGSMQKLKDMWSDLSKKGKWLVGSLVVIILLIIANYII